MVKIKVLLLAVLLVGLGYGINSWVNGTNVKAQEPTAIADVSRFQIVKAVSGPNSDWGVVLLDSVQGRAFRFIAGPTHDPEILEIPVKICTIDDCTNWKRVGSLQ